MTTKISIDAVMPDGTLVDSNRFETITKGCFLVLLGLPNYIKLIEAIRVTWVAVQPVQGREFKTAYGPDFTFYFVGLGELKGSYSADYRFIGTGDPEPSNKDIFLHFACQTGLRRYIREHAARCSAQLQRHQSTFLFSPDEAKRDEVIIG